MICFARPLQCDDEKYSEGRSGYLPGYSEEVKKEPDAYVSTASGSLLLWLFPIKDIQVPGARYSHNRHS